MPNRTLLIAGNWKMNNDVAEAAKLADELAQALPEVPAGVEVLVCPPTIDITTVHDRIQAAPIALGAQNVYWEAKGAFTGESSCDMLKCAGCTYCIIGHSERRDYFHETDEDQNKKAKALVAAGLVPVFCCGESLEVREAGTYVEHVVNQVKAGLAGLEITCPKQVVIAMAMHVGAPCKPIVAVGDQVKVGQKIGEIAGLGAPIHASVSGVVKAVEPRPYVGGGKVMSVVIENDFQDTWGSVLTPHPDYSKLSCEEIVEIVKEAGITGMGGAGFPTHVKISSGVGKVDTLILNGAECEPYITADHRLMLEQGERVIRFDKARCRWVMQGTAAQLAAQRRVAEYEAEPIVKTLRVLLQQGDGTWSGYSKNLMEMGQRYAHTELAPTSQALAKRITELEPMLWERDAVKHWMQDNGSSAKRHCFRQQRIDNTVADSSSAQLSLRHKYC